MARRSLLSLGDHEDLFLLIAESFPAKFVFGRRRVSEGDRARGVEGIHGIAEFANDLGINLCIEVLNCFEDPQHSCRRHRLRHRCR